MTRVLHVLDSMGMGGIQSFIMNLYRSIDTNEIQFDFLLHRLFYNVTEADIKKLGGNIYMVPTRREGMRENKKALESFFEHHKEYDAIHFHISSLTYIEPLKVAAKEGIPVRIVHSHSSQAPKNNRLHRILHEINKRRIQKYATHFYACSDSAAQWFYGGTKLFNRSVIIKNGIHLNKYSYDKEIRNAYRKAFKVEDKTIIGHVGRFHYPKNHEFMIEIFNAYAKIDNKAVLMLAGDGENKPNIEQKVHEYGLSDRIVFLGNRNDVSNLLQMFDLFLLPSRYEGFPVTLVEAQAASLPCVVSASVTHTVNITGKMRFCKLNDSLEIWAQSIQDLLNTNRDPKDFSDVKQAGYDINDIISYLSKVYHNDVN